MPTYRLIMETHQALTWKDMYLASRTEHPYTESIFMLSMLLLRDHLVGIAILKTAELDVRDACDRWSTRAGVVRGRSAICLSMPNGGPEPVYGV